MKPKSSVSFVKDANTNNNNDSKLEFANFYDKLIKPQIDELAALMISSTANMQYENIEDLTNSLFSNLEKLDSENMIVLNGYKVVSRAYFILNWKRPQSSKIFNESNENQTEKNQKKQDMIEKQNEEILDKMTKYLEAQPKENKSKQSITAIRKELKQFQDNVNQVVNNITENLNLENVTDINNLDQAIIEYKNQNEKLNNSLQNELNSLKETISQLQVLDSDPNDKSTPSSKNIIIKLTKENSDLKTNNEALISENEKLKKQLQNAPNINTTHKRENKDYSVKEINGLPYQFSELNPEQQQQQLLNIISQKDELIDDLKNERDKLKSFVNNKIFSNMPNKNQNDIFDDPIKLKTELNLLKVKYDKLNATNTKLKAKLKKLNKLESVVEELKAQIKKSQEEQQIEMTKMTLEKDELKSQISDRADLNAMISELESKSDEVRKLTETVNQISIQLSDQSKEISEEEKVKSALIKIVERQSSVLSEYERIVVEKMNFISQQETEISKFNSILNNSKQLEKNNEKQNNELFEELEQLVSQEIEDDSISQDILFTLSNRRPEDIITAFKKLANQAKNSKSNFLNQKHTKSEFDKLYNYLLSLTKTLRMVVNNSEIDGDQKSEILRECILVDSFINENAPGLREEPTIFDSFGININETLFLEQITSLVNDSRELETDQSKELFSILTYVIVMNTILRKTALSYRDQCEVRAFEVKRLKNSILELQQMNDDLNQVVENENEEEESSSKKEENKIKSRNGLIEKDIDTNEGEFKQKYLALKETFQKSKKNYSSNISKYKKKVELLTNQNNELRTRLGTHKTILSEASQVSEQSNNAIKSLKNELSTCEAELGTSQMIIKKQREEINSLKNALSTQCEKLKQKTNETIRKEKQNSEEMLKEIQSDHQNEIRKIHQLNKIKVSKLNDELENEKRRCQSLKSRYDDILEDLREKLNESRGFEMQAKLEFNKKEAEIVALKGKVSALNVDNKMMKVKFANLEEKSTRERTFNANQNIAQQIAIEQQTTAKMNELETSMKRKEQLFLQSLCFILNDYVNQTEAVSVENVKKYLQKAMNDNSRMKKSLEETKIITNEIIKIRSIVKPERNQSTSDAVQQLVDQLNDSFDATNKENETKVEDNEATTNSHLLKVWTSWARRVFTLATDSTSTAKSDKELRNMIEECVIQNSMVKNNRFVVESLRKQKKILLSKIPLRSTKRCEQSILSLLIVYAAIKRMQKMSGNLHIDFVLPKMTEIEQKKNSAQRKIKGKSQNNQKNYPLINSYE